MRRDLLSASVAACLIFLTGGVSPGIAIEYVDSIDDCFQIEKVEEVGAFVKYRMTNPYTEHSPFVALGMNGLQSSAYLQAHGNAWPGGDGYPGPLAWIEDQVKFLIDINMNTIAGWLTHINSGGEDKWLNHAAMLHGYNYPVYLNYGCDCAENAPPDDFSHYNVAGNAELVRRVNLELPTYHQNNAGDYPQTYFPFVMYLYPVTPYDYNEILEDMLPDIWNEYFEQRLYVMGFLVLSDGTEPEAGNECDGRWIYAQVPDPMVEEHQGVPTLKIPDYFVCHKPEGMREWKSLISYALSDDLQWAYSIDGTSSYSGEYRPWIRRILCQDSTGDEIPAGRSVFAKAMKEHYFAKYEDPIAQWNQTSSYSQFLISRFMEGDMPDPRYEDFASLEKMPNPFCYDCLKTSYPNGITKDNNDDLSTWLKTTEHDLGCKLTTDDAAEFTRIMAAHYYPLVIDAIRFFDGCHLISSANFNWFREGGTEDGFKGMQQFYPVFEEMSKAKGHVFEDEEKDIISYINTQFYPILPSNEDEGDGEGSTYHTFFCNLCDAFGFFLDNDLRELPFMTASYTSHADWEKEWDFNWDEEGYGPPCPRIEEPDPGERWYDCAPFPHGDMDNCIINLGDEDCYHPYRYSYTETGLLQRPPETAEETGRGDDYHLVTSASFYPEQYGEPPLDYYFILGYSWHSFYDSGFDGETGDPTPESENWGIVNPKCMESWESSGTDEQYIELHDFIRDMNGYIQVELGDGSTWSKKPGPDPPPETTDPFVCGE